MFITLGSKLYREIVGIPIGVNCAHIVAVWFCFVFIEIYFMFSLPDNNQADVSEVFNSTLNLTTL